MNADVTITPPESTFSGSRNPVSSVREANILNQVADVCRQFEINSLRLQIEACEKLIADDESIDVVVLGNFKAGKSSFLNNLVGENILPVGVLPLTAIITRLRYGDSVKATVHFLDGTSSEVQVAEVGKYIAESENPKNATRVSNVLIETPALKAYAGLQFIDTPGLNSIYAHNSATSRNWLPRVGAAILTVSADHPFSEQDAGLLNALLHSTPKMNILLTKADLLSAEQLNDVKDFIHQQIAAITSERIPIFIYSTLIDAASHRNILDRELLLPLALCRISESGNILRHKLGALITDSLNYVNIGLAAAQQDESNLTGLREQILDKKNNDDAVIEELRLVEKDCISKTRPQVEEVVQCHQTRLQHELIAELKSRLPEWKLNLWKLSRTYET
jgi:GTP-binding protein EngB required for normal cell division